MGSEMCIRDRFAHVLRRLVAWCTAAIRVPCIKGRYNPSTGADNATAVRICSSCPQHAFRPRQAALPPCALILGLLARVTVPALSRCVEHCARGLHQHQPVQMCGRILRHQRRRHHPHLQTMPSRHKLLRWLHPSPSTCVARILSSYGQLKRRAKYRCAKIQRLTIDDKVQRVHR